MRFTPLWPPLARLRRRSPRRRNSSASARARSSPRPSRWPSALAGLSGFVMTMYYGSVGYAAATRARPQGADRRHSRRRRLDPRRFSRRLARRRLRGAVVGLFRRRLSRRRRVYSLLAIVLALRPGGLLGERGAGAEVRSDTSLGERAHRHGNPHHSMLYSCLNKEGGRPCAPPSPSTTKLSRALKRLPASRKSRDWFSTALNALIAQESARRLARLGGSEPQIGPAPRRRR